MQILYYVAASIDGYIATLDGGIEWLKPFDESGEDYGYNDFYSSIDGLVMGSGTYAVSLELGAWGWPGKPCRVLSRQTLDPATEDVVVTAQTPREVAGELRSLGLKRVWMVGGGAVATAFRREGLMTDMILSVVPIVLGDGIPLFASGGESDRIELLEMKSWPSGLTQMEYRWSENRQALHDGGEPEG